MRRYSRHCFARLLMGFMLLFTVTSVFSLETHQTVAIDHSRQILLTLENPLQPAPVSAGSTWKGWNWSGGYRASPGVEATAKAIERDYAMRLVDAWPIRLLGMYCVVFTVNESVDRQSLIDQLALDARITLVQPLNIFATATQSSPEPKSYGQLQYSLNEMSVKAAHKVSTGKGVRVAVIDTGAELDHPDLGAAIRTHKDFVRRQNDVFSDDIHGTAVAGIIAAADDERGTQGVAPDADVMVFKACWPSKEGAERATCNSFTLAKAISEAVDERADILNLSLGGPRDPLLSALVSKALEMGVLVVGAEPPTDVSNPFPTEIAGVIAAYDGEGVEPASGKSVPAPGKDVITTAPHSDYGYFSGSSISAAHVSGILALMRSLDQSISGDDLAAHLRNSVQMQRGVRSLNACIAINKLFAQVTCKS